MATTTAKGSGSTVNNGGTVVKAGAITSDSPVTKVLGVNDLADDVGASHGSRVVAQGGGASAGFVGVKKAQSGGSLAYNASATEWIVRGGNVTTTLGGVANDVLVSAASNRNGVTITDFIGENLKVSRNGLYSDREFNVLAKPSAAMVPGRAKGTGAGTTVTLSSDNAAVPTRGVPGELTYHFGAGTGAVTDEYKARDTFEDATDTSS
jgi:hypothetical protein